MPTSNPATLRRAHRRDKVARWVITLGGVIVIASVIAIVALIVGVTLPLFQGTRCAVALTARLPDSIPPQSVLGLGMDMGVDGQQMTAHVWTASGLCYLLDLRSGEVLGKERVKPPAGVNSPEIRRVELLPNGPGRTACYAISWSHGSTSLVEITSLPQFGPEGERTFRYTVRALAALPALPAEKSLQPRQVLVRRSDAGAITRVVLLPGEQISILRQVTTENEMSGEQETKTDTAVIREEIVSEIRTMTMDREGKMLYAGTRDGRLVRWQLDDKGRVAEREVVRAFRDRRAVTSLAMVLGDVSLAVGDAEGGLTTWFSVRADSTRKLRLIHELHPHDTAVREILPSGRNKSLLSLGGDGALHLDHMTSQRHLASIPPDPDNPLRAVAFGPRGDVVLGLDAGRGMTVWQIEGACPEVSLGTLFGRVHYEDYDEPQYAWQTTGGEDFEPKLSLVPLLFGTLKGTFYAMLLAVPLALFGAAYTSHFTTPAFRRVIKPVVEIMAAVPSVVIGFLIALWLAPIIERWVLALLASLVTVPATFLAFMAMWQVLRSHDWAKHVENGYEFLVLLPVLLLGAAMAAWLAAPLESWLFGGNFKLWLYNSPLGMRYDQRNCVIIAFGLGFTVIPIIFSIAEDSLSNVPHSMAAASMALGASRWQTLWRVILPSASPGIFAAVMIGFGRAVGETMIVLMATGNTPIVDFSPLNGMRTLSANIAVEIPEAPVGGTLYRVLFLCAVLLFVLTFILNTAAELVRQRLRKKYGRF